MATLNRRPTQATTRMAVRYETPAAKSVTRGAPSARNVAPTIRMISRTVATSTQGRDVRMMSDWASLAGSAPVTPTNESPGSCIWAAYR